MKHTPKRALLALLLVFVLVMNLLPVGALAAEDTDEETVEAVASSEQCETELVEIESTVETEPPTDLPSEEYTPAEDLTEQDEDEEPEVDTDIDPAVGAADPDSNEEESESNGTVSIEEEQVSSADTDDATEDVISDENVEITSDLPDELVAAAPNGVPVVGQSYDIYAHYDTNVQLSSSDRPGYSAAGFPYMTTCSKYIVNGHTSCNSSDGTLFYCIDWGAHLGSGEKDESIPQPFEKNPKWTSLSDTAQIGIKLATMYGCPNNSSLDNIYGYAATQMIVWEFQRGTRTDYSIATKSFSNTLANSPTTKAAYETILTNMAAHDNTPSFDGGEYELDGTGKDYGITLTDSKGVLGTTTWSLVCDNDAINVEQNGNDLLVWADRAVSDVKLTLYRNVPLKEHSNAVVIYHGSQAAITGNLGDPVPISLTISAKDTAKVSLVKIAPPAGNRVATFRLYHGLGDYNAKRYTEITTNASGNSSVFELICDGSFYYVEEMLPKDTPYTPNYTMEFDHVESHGISGQTDGRLLYNFKPIPGETATITCTNYWEDASATITKVSEDGKAMSGITFEVFEGWTNYQSGVLFAEVTTDAEGKANIAELKPYFSYYVKEIVPMGYSKRPEWTVTGTDVWQPTGSSESILYFKAMPKTNVEIHCKNFEVVNGEIRKVSSSAHLDGYQFKFYSYGAEATKRNFYGVSDQSGSVYETDKDWKQPKLNADGSLNYNFTGFRDAKLVGDRYWFLAMMETLKEEDFDAGLMPVSWYIRVDNADGKTVFEHTYYARENGNDVGIFADPNNANTYRIEVYSLVADGSNPFVGLNAGGSITMEIDNEYVTQDLHLTKTSSTTGELLTGAEFTLYDADGSEPGLGLLQDNNDGSYTFGNLRVGSYTLRETKAPDGYVLDDTIYHITVTKDGIESDLPVDELTNDYTIPNTPVTGKIEVLKTNESNDPLEGVELLLEWKDGEDWNPVILATEDTMNQIGSCTSEGLTEDGKLLTDADGKAVFEGLRVLDDNGQTITYRLTETATLPGYSLLADPIYEGAIPAVEAEETEADAETCYALYLHVVNSESLKMPNTGSNGLDFIPYCMMGMILMAAAIVLLRRKKA